MTNTETSKSNKFITINQLFAKLPESELKAIQVYFDEYINDKTFNEFCESEYNYKTFIPLTDEEEKLIINNSNSYWLNDEWYHEYHTFFSVNLNEILRDFRLYGKPFQSFSKIIKLV